MHRARPMLLLLLVLQFAGWPPAARAADEEADATGPLVEQIRWFGNHALSSGTLRDHILTQGPRWPRFWVMHPLYEDELLEDMKRIHVLYRQAGYYEAKAGYELIHSEDGKRVTIHVTIDEGEPVRLETLRIRLPDGEAPTTHPVIQDKPWEKLLDGLALRPGAIFELGHYGSAREKILAWLADRGYPRAQLEGGADVDLKRHGVEVSWTLSLGPRVRLGQVEVQGLEDVAPRVVLREVRLDPGQWYSLRTIAKTRRRIQNLGLFRWTVVEAEPPKGEPSYTDEASLLDPPEEVTWPLSIRLKERPPRRVRIGGGWGTDTFFRGELSWQHRDFLGGAQHLDISLRGSGLGATFRPSFMEPYFLGTRTRLLVSPALIYELQDAYKARRIVVDVQLQRDLFERWTVRLGYRFDRDDIYSVLDNPGPDDLPEGVSITTGPNAGLRRSTVDNLLNARNGTWINLEADSSVTALGSDQDFMRYTLDTRGFLEIYRTVLAGRVLLATIQNLGDTDEEEIPLVERLYSGGASSMRGFGYRSLSPKDANGDSIGGSSVVEASVEWRVPIWKSLGAVAFVDAAQVDPDPWRFRVDHLLYAAGPGLRYATPAGPIRVDFAWRLNPARSRGTFRVSASLGHAF